MAILYCVSALDVGTASIRYRAMLPALYLNRAGIAAEVTTSKINVDALQQTECLVIVKSFNEHTLKLCLKARRLQVPVILDLCDDIFDDGYGGVGGDLGRNYFAAMAGLSSLIVTTTSVLADRIRQHAPSAATIHVIADMVERTSDAEELQQRYPTPAIQEVPVAKPKKPRSFSKKLRRKLRKLARKTWRAVGGVAPAQPAPSQAAPAIQPALPVAPIAPAHPVASDDDKIVLWFGHHGSLHSDTGMTQLLWLAADLARLSREHQLRLVVVSNSKEKFDRYIRPLPFRTEYVEWSPATAHAQLERADVCVVPFGDDRFSRAKSPNRIVLSLASGVPVVASSLPSLGSLRDCILIEDWYDSIKTYLERPDVVRAHLSLAQSVLKQQFDGPQIAAMWQRSVAFAREKHRAAAATPRLLFFFQLMQDFDLLLPLLRAAQKECDVTIGILANLSLVAPSLVNALSKLGSRTFFLHETEFPSLERLDPRVSCSALVTASETSAGPHQFAAQLTRVVRSNGIPTFTLQHGVENIGLTFKDDRYDEHISFESDFILTWADEGRLSPWVSEATRAKIVPVGCPKPIIAQEELPDFPLQDRKFVAVFENLHWSRYSDDFRAHFLTCLVETARSFPDLAFVLKPHPAGQWFTVRCEMALELPDNVMVADGRESDWGRFGADAFLVFTIGVITTPSTTAFDAARYLKPVAVAAGDMQLDMYEPLPLLRSEADWISYVRQLRDGSVNLSVVRSYRDIVSLPGEPMRRAMAAIRAASDGGGLPAMTEAIAQIDSEADELQGTRTAARTVAAL